MALESKIESLYYKTEFYSGGCNIEHRSICWSKNDDVAYCSGQNIVFLKLSLNDDLLFNFIIDGNDGYIKSVFWLDAIRLLCILERNIIIYEIDSPNRGYNVILKENFEKNILSTFYEYESKLHFILYDEKGVELFYIDHELKKHANSEVIHINTMIPLCGCIFEINGCMFYCIGGTSKTFIVLYKNGETTVELKLDGHDGWIRDISSTRIDDETYLLGTCSQDKSICIWKIVKSKSTEEDIDIKNLIKKYDIKIENDEWNMMKESILLGHECRVMQIDWIIDDVYPKLVSIGHDYKIIIWSYIHNNNIWSDKIHITKHSEYKDGYIGAAFNKYGTKCAYYSRDGCINMSCLDKNSSNYFIDKYISCGYNSIIKCISTHPKDLPLLITCGNDMSARIFGYINHLNENTWIEISKPISHGYTLNSVKFINEDTIITAASENCIRVHSATIGYYKILEKYKIINQLPNNIDEKCLFAVNQPLNLTQIEPSDKNIFKNDELSKYLKNDKISLDLIPNKVINDFTLWTEKEVLYEHGNEVLEVIINNSCNLIASSCHARKSNDATILLWDSESFELISKLEGHRLTVVEMKFSPNDKYLISVSLDRNIIIFYNNNSPNTIEYKLPNSFKNIYIGESLVSRAFVSCCWLNDSYFMTASRDSKLMIFEIHDEINVKLLNTTLIKNEPIKMCYCNKYNDNFIILLSSIPSCVDLYTFCYSTNTLNLLDNSLLLSSPAIKLNCFKFNPSCFFQIALSTKDKEFRILNFYLK